MSVKVGDRVKVVKADGELSPLVGATGEVIRIYDLSRTVAAVKIAPDETIAREIIVKLPVEYLEKVGSQTQETEIPEGAKQISREDFAKALNEITDPEKMFSGKSDGLVSLARLLTAKIVGKDIETKLFGDRDVVVMTEDEFSVALWDACNPVAVDETTGGKMGAGKTLKISITAIIALEEIVDILFGGSDD